jgi:hypothetical protein
MAKARERKRTELQAEFDALEMVMNWTEEEAQTQADRWEELLKVGKELRRQLQSLKGAEVIEVLQNVRYAASSQVLQDTPARVMLRVIRDIGLRLAKTGPPLCMNITEMITITLLANEPLANFRLNSPEIDAFVSAAMQAPTRTNMAPPEVCSVAPDNRFQSPLLLPILSARGLWSIMEGKASLAECPAPKGPVGCKCGRWFVIHGRGRRGTYCSDACRQRAHQRPNELEREAVIV